MDTAAPDHPVLARRGGHFAVVNSAALQAAGIGADTPDPPGGKIGRLADGSRDGTLEGGAVYQVAAFAPAPGPLPPWTLTIEHALLADAAQRQRAVQGGFGITVQHAILWNMGSEMLHAWGPDRTARVNPLDEWLALGANLAAGTDIVRPFNPMTNVWGMVTRGTKAAAVQGPKHAIDVTSALRLYTMGTAELNGEADRLGSVTPGKLPTWSATAWTR